MPYIDQLPAFDPKIDLTSADLRDLERKKGLGDLVNAIDGPLNPSGPNGQKTVKAAFEVELFRKAISRFKQFSAEHPPYGLVIPTAESGMVILNEPFQLSEKRYFSAEETALMQGIGSMNTLHALSDLKMQIILHELLTEAAASPEFSVIRHAGDAYASTISDGRATGWKQLVQSAASNAKRSDFVLLKQIIIQWVRAMGRLPTREEFQEVAIQSQSLLETLATTHQEVFKVLNGKIIADANHGNIHRLVQRNGKGEITLKKGVLSGLRVERGLSRTRTMCAGLLAKDDDGVSLLEHSYREDLQIVTGMLYSNGESQENIFDNVARQKLPNPSIHMFLKLKHYAVAIGEGEQE